MNNIEHSWFDELGVSRQGFEETQSFNNKNCIAEKNMLGGALLKSCKCSWNFRKTFFWESVRFHLNMFDVTKFRLVLVLFFIC